MKVAGRQRETRFPLDASLKVIKSWQDDTRVALRRIAPTASRGTFAADAARYLQGVASMPTLKERAKHVELWVAEFGGRLRASISTSEIDIVLSRWLSEGKSAGTVRHRRAVLLHLFNRLDGPAQPNPVRRAMKPALPEPEDRSVSYAVINRILAAMPDVGQGIAGKDRDDASKSKSKARLSVIAFVLLPHSTLKRLTPDCIGWAARTIRVPRRQKGQGAKSRTLALTEAGLAALRQFDALDAYGPFSNSAIHKSWKRACKAAKVVPAPRPYDLRHSFATLISGDRRHESRGRIADARAGQPHGRALFGRRRRTAPPARSRSLQQEGEASEMASSRGWQSAASIWIETRKCLILSQLRLTRP